MQRFLFLTLFFLTSLSQAEVLAEPEIFIATNWDKNQISLAFIAKAEPAWIINANAPWSLVIKGDDDHLSLTKLSYNKTDFLENVPGFKVIATPKPNTSSGRITYTLTGFFCSKDKKKCTRKIFSDQYIWQKSRS